MAVLESGVTERPERPTISNAVLFLLAPRLTPDDTDQGIVSVIPNFDEDRQKLIVISNPRPGPKRSVELLLTPTDNSPPPKAIPRDPAPTSDLAPDEIQFDVGDVRPGRYRIRLRVESPRVESLPIRRVDDGIVLDSRQEVQL